MQIQVNSATMEIAEGGTLWADIWVEAEDFCYPERNWNDIVIGALSMWGWGCVHMIDHEDEAVLLRFLDGAYYIECKRTSDQLIAEFVKEGVNLEVEHSCQSSAREFLSSYVRAFDAIYAGYMSATQGVIDLAEQGSIQACIGAREKIADYLKNTDIG